MYYQFLKIRIQFKLQNYLFGKLVSLRFSIYFCESFFDSAANLTMDLNTATFEELQAGIGHGSDLHKRPTITLENLTLHKRPCNELTIDFILTLDIILLRT